MKVCSRCQREQPLENFHKRGGARKSPCKSCRKQQSVTDKPQWQQTNFVNNLRRKFGITPDDYQRLFTAQHGLCALCGRPPQRYRLAVDHCHETGRIRGLLCSRCNGALGTFGDSLDGLEKVKEYLS